MEHPFFKSLRILTLYLCTWATVFVVHFVILWVNYKVELGLAIWDSFFSNFLFCILGLSLWLPLKYYSNIKAHVFNLITHHLTYLVFVIFVWIGLSLFVLRITSTSAAYDDFLVLSIPSRAITGIFYYSITVMAYYLMNYYNDLQERLLNEGRLKERIKEAELNILRSQINPHFLFNSLNSISYLTITNPEKAQEMVIKLSDFMRYSVSQSAEQNTTLKAELENIRRYLEIEQVRFGEKLRFELETTDKCLEAKLPAMILQPLYENAVKHGVYDSLEPITIKTTCTCDGNFLYLKIRNNMDVNKIARKGNGIGLKNISERLKLIYQTDGLFITRNTETWFEVLLTFPQL
jgi:two-component system, LytTR family, sensor kinase